MLRLLFLFALSMVLAACTADERAPLVLAPSSMEQVLEELVGRWAEEGHVRPRLSFAGTQVQARLLQSGLPADLFISADRQWFDRVEADGLIKVGEDPVLARNMMVLVEPRAGRSSRGEDRPFAIADPQAVPAGRYGEAALIAAGLWDGVKGNLARTENVRGALRLVERGEARQGAVYCSDVAVAKDVVIVAPLPLPPSDSPTYFAAIGSSAPHGGEAQAFLDWMQGREARAIFRRNGFGECRAEGEAP